MVSNVRLGLHPEPSQPIPGPSLAAVEATLLDPGWRSVTVENRGPDGQHVLSLVVFGVCPVCAATVAVPDEAGTFIAAHEAFHRETAAAIDARA